MSTKEKFRQRLMQKITPRDITPEELKSYLNFRGFQIQSVNGDHFIYYHPKLNYRLTIVKKNPVAFAYIKNVKSAIIEMEEIEEYEKL